MGTPTKTEQTPELQAAIALFNAQKNIEAVRGNGGVFNKLNSPATIGEAIYNGLTPEQKASFKEGVSAALKKLNESPEEFKKIIDQFAKAAAPEASPSVTPPNKDAQATSVPKGSSTSR